MADSYDPHDNRTVEKPIKNWEAFVALLKCSIGTGILSMPFAFQGSGWINGLISSFCIGLLIMIGLHVLLRSIYEISRLRQVPTMPYYIAVRETFLDGPKCLKPGAHTAGAFVDFFLGFYHFGIAGIYVVFVSRTIRQLVESNTDVNLDIRVYMLIALPFFIAIAAIRSLKRLVPLSMIANILIFLGLGVILYYVFIALPPLTDLDTFGKIERYPMFIAILLFAVESLGVLIAIEENMETPKDYLGYCGILNMGLTVVVILYALFGFVGYWRYNTDVKSVIILNLPQNEILSQVVKGLYAVAVYFSYPLQLYVTIDIMWNHYIVGKIKNENRHLMYELLFRAVVAIASVLIAMAIPEIGTFISLIGSFCLCVLSFIFPGFMDIALRHETGFGRMNFYLMLDVLLIAFGLIAGIIGTFVSVKDVIDLYTKKNEK